MQTLDQIKWGPGSKRAQISDNKFCQWIWLHYTWVIKHIKIMGFGSMVEQNHGAKKKKKVPSFYNQLLKDSAREMHSNELVV